MKIARDFRVTVKFVCTTMVARIGGSHRGSRTGNSPSRTGNFSRGEQQPPLTGQEASPNWSTTGGQKSAANLQAVAVPARVTNPVPPPLASFPVEILAKQSYVSFESEPERGLLSRNTTVPGNPSVLAHSASSMPQFLPRSIFLPTYLSSIYMHVCMHVCMHACMHACTYVYTFVYMHTCMHAYMHVCMHVCMYAFMNVHTYMRMCVCECVYMYDVCMHVCMHVCTYVYSYVCMCVYIYVCMCVCMHACMYVHTYIRLCTCMYIRIYIRVYVYAYVFVTIPYPRAVCHDSLLQSCLSRSARLQSAFVILNPLSSFSIMCTVYTV